MEYGRIIKRALAISWRHKVLWIFGIAAAFFGGHAGGGQGFGYSFNGGDVARWQRSMPWGPQLPMGPGRALPFSSWQGVAIMLLGLVVVLLVIAAVLFIVGIIVRYTSLGALVGMVDEIEKTEHATFRSGLNKGWGRMLRLFAIDLLIGLASFVVFLPILVIVVLGLVIVIGPAIPLFSGGSGLVVLGIGWIIGAGLLLILFIVLVALALSMLRTLVREFAFRACVIEQKGVFQAIGAAIALIRAQPRESVLMWLLMLGINLALGLLAIPATVLSVGVLLGPAFVAATLLRSVLAGVLVAIPFLFVIMVAAVLIMGLYITFYSAVWTLTYRELRGKQALGQQA